MDLQKDLGNDLWNDKLLSLTRKQNEYVTHPKSRTPALPSLWPTTNKSRPSNTTAQVQNGSLVIFRPDGLGKKRDLYSYVYYIMLLPGRVTLMGWMTKLSY